MTLPRYNILLIEDDLSAIEFARRAVGESFPDIDLTVVGGGDATLSWPYIRDETIRIMPNIILMDLNFPKLDGLAVLRKLRLQDETNVVPVVAFSTEHTREDVLMGYQVGVNSFVPKPVDLAQLKELFSDRLAYWTKMHENEADSSSGKQGSNSDLPAELKR